MRNSHIIATFAVTALSASVAIAQPSLCSTSETTYFTCSTGRKVISLCASPDLSDLSGTLQYRFGTPGGSVELAYPTPTAHPAKYFKAYLSSFAKGGTSAIGFDIGAYSYSLFETHSTYGYNGAGVAMRKRGVPMKTVECKTQTPEISKFYYDLSKLKLPPEELDHIGPEQ